MTDMNKAANVALHPATELAQLRSEVARLTASLAELRQRDAHLRIAMQASNVVAYEWNIVQDRVTRLRCSSEPGAALEDAGNFESVVARVLEEDQQTFRNDIAAALASDDGGYRTEVRYQRPDGEIRWVSESGRVLRDEQGRSERMVGVTFDITDRKHAEEALRAGRGAAARAGRAQGRVPGDAGPRTAQSAGPDPQRGADPAAQRHRAGNAGASGARRSSSGRSAR